LNDSIFFHFSGCGTLAVAFASSNAHFVMVYAARVSMSAWHAGNSSGALPLQLLQCSALPAEQLLANVYMLVSITTEMYHLCMPAAVKEFHKKQSPPYDGPDDHSDVEDAEDYRKGVRRSRSSASNSLIESTSASARAATAGLLQCTHIVPQLLIAAQLCLYMKAAAAVAPYTHMQLKNRQLLPLAWSGHAGGYHPVYVGEKFKQGRYVVLKKLGWGHFSTVWLVLDNNTHTFAALKVRGCGLAWLIPAADLLAVQQRQQRYLFWQCPAEATVREHRDFAGNTRTSLLRCLAPYPRNDICLILQVQKSAQHYTEAARDEITLLSEIRDGDADNCKHCCRLLDSFEHAGPHGLHVCMVFEVLGDNMLALIKAFDYKGVPLPVVRSLTRQMLVALDYLHR
jgi:hypothetical protein